MLIYRPQRPIWIGFAGFLIATLLALSSFAQSVLPVPKLTARVIDQTATLTPDQMTALSSQLEKLEQERGAQVVVLMVASTQPEDIFSFSNRVANLWKIGRKDVGDGILIVVAKNDRKLRIEIAKSLEGAIPDVLAGQIISESMTPQFKQGQYASGLQAGVTQIAARLGTEVRATATRSYQQRSQEVTNTKALYILFLFIIVLMLAPLFPFLNKILIVVSGGFRSGDGFSSGDSYSSGGGFSSGGGGNFGGGGASGDW